VFLKELFGSWCDEMFEVVRFEPLPVLWGQAFVCIEFSKVTSNTFEQTVYSNVKHGPATNIIHETLLGGLGETCEALFTGLCRSCREGC
jgi:hypothetical protein